MATGNAMVVIGKSTKPRCFSGVRNPPCRYRSQKKSWMDCALFTEWVMELDRQFVAEKRNVALLIDNCRAHPTVEGLKAISLFFLPPNKTSVTQPMDQGIIRSLKAQDRTISIRQFVVAVDAKKPLPQFTILEAMNMLVMAWNNVSTSTVIHCFRGKLVFQRCPTKVQ